MFQPVPVRQWVLSLPHRVRYLLAWGHDLCRAVTAVFLRAVMGFLRDRATRCGAAHGRGGAVAIVQRFGAALNLNVHIHALVLDGVFAVGANGRPAFREGDPPSDEDVGLVLGVVRRRVERLLDRRGHGVDDNHAGVVAPAAHRHRLKRLCRYGLRPPVAEERLQVTSDGQVLLRLRHRWSDGTTDILFEPTEFLERLAAITPRPRINLVLY